MSQESFKECGCRMDGNHGVDSSNCHQHGLRAMLKRSSQNEPIETKKNHCPFNRPQCLNGCYFPYECARARAAAFQQNRVEKNQGLNDEP